MITNDLCESEEKPTGEESDAFITEHSKRLGKEKGWVKKKTCCSSSGSRGEPWRLGLPTPCPQDFFKIMQFSGNFKGKTLFRANFGLGVKTPLAPLTKILDLRLRRALVRLKATQLQCIVGRETAQDVIDKYDRGGSKNLQPRTPKRMVKN